MLLALTVLHCNDVVCSLISPHSRQNRQYRQTEKSCLVTDNAACSARVHNYELRHNRDDTDPAKHGKLCTQHTATRSTQLTHHACKETARTLARNSSACRGMAPVGQLVWGLHCHITTIIALGPARRHLPQPPLATPPTPRVARSRTARTGRAVRPSN